jgi:RNase P protein component
LQGYDLIFLATPAAVTAEFKQLEEAVAQLLRRIESRGSRLEIER